jgi:hypothetical protein
MSFRSIHICDRCKMETEDKSEDSVYSIDIRKGNECIIPKSVDRFTVCHSCFRKIYEIVTNG